jgi:hypothetical protein
MSSNSTLVMFPIILMVLGFNDVDRGKGFNNDSSTAG